MVAYLFMIVGPFESDALLVPPKCRFEHMHDDSNCLSHDQWHTRASDKCQSEGMIVKDYGVLIPCGTGKFTGVEFVCCPQDASDEKATDAAKIVPISEAAGTSKPTSVMEHLKQEISKFAKHVEESTIGMLWRLKSTISDCRWNIILQTDTYVHVCAKCVIGSCQCGTDFQGMANSHE